MEVPRFLSRTNQRVIPADYDGDVFVWDIDKTYLDTRFSSVRGLLSIPFELAVDKHAVPGAVPLLRALRRGATGATVLPPLFFVSGSPVQLRRVIEQKMTLDGVQFDGITFKDQWGLLKARRPRGIKEQVGYKLAALLLYRLDVPGPSRWFLFGDDVEADADVFSLFDAICGGLRGGDLTTALAGRGVHPDDIAAVTRLAEALPTRVAPVERALIHLARGSSPSTVDRDQVLGTISFLQTALILAALERIQPDAIRAVAQDLRKNGRVSEPSLRRQLDDAEARLGIPEDLLQYARRG